MGKKAILITVRSNSSRLPNKSYKKIKGKHTIEYVIDQAKKSNLADMIILCTTKLTEDDMLCEIATNNNIAFFRGSEEDKLQRWLDTCDRYNIEFFVTADGDDLFCSHELMDVAFKQFDDEQCDFIHSNEVVCGSFTYGIKTTALRKVCEIKDTNDTEMMYVYFTETGLFELSLLKNIPAAYRRSDIRMTLDYKDDFNFFSKVVEQIDLPAFDTRDILTFLDKNKELVNINFYLEERWKNNQISKTELKLKEAKNGHD